MRILNHVYPVDGLHQHSALKLESLSLSYLETAYSRDQLLRVLKERRDHNLGLKELAVRSCPTDEGEDMLKIRELVEEVKWGCPAVWDSDEEGADGGSDEEGDYDFDDDVDVCEGYQGYTFDSS